MADEAVFDSDPACSKQRWIVTSGLVGLTCLALCCAAGAVWLLYRRLFQPASGVEGRDKKDLKEEKVRREQGAKDASFVRFDPPSKHCCTIAQASPPAKKDAGKNKQQEDWDLELLDEAEAVPTLLHVSALTNQTSCTGLYELMPNERPNGRPLWALRDGCRWLYSGTDGRWYIGGVRSRDRNFSCSSGFIYCNQQHRNLPPDKMLSGWEWGHGGGWHKDPSITVVAVDWQAPVKANGRTASATTVMDCSKEDEFRCDGPGMYQIVHEHTAVTPGVLLSDPVEFLSAGALVRVMEVTFNEQDHRLRGRIEKPDGWISLENTQDGYIWAQKQGVPGWRKTQDPSDVSTDATGSAHSQRAESEASPDSGSFTLADKRTLPPVASFPCSSAGHSPGLRARAVDPPEARPLPAKDAQPMLFVISPNGQIASTGVYELVRGEQPNGAPLWKQQQGDRWLYCGVHGRWSIAGLDVKQDNFTRSAGFITQSEITRDLLPDEYTAPWQRWSGSKFELDFEIRITAWNPCSPPSTPSSAGLRVPQAAALRAHAAKLEQQLVEGSGDCIMDLRGCGLSAEDKGVVQASKTALGVIV